LKSRIAILLPLLAIAFGISASAQKVAIVDMQGAILTTKEGQKAAEELKTKFGPTEQDLNKRQQDLQAKQDSYRKTQNTISADEKAKLEREIDVAQKALARDAQDARDEFTKAQNELLGGIMQKMQSVLMKYSTEKGLTMVVDVSQQANNLLYADKSANISADLVALYDAAPPAPAPGTAAPAAAPPAAAPKPAAPRPVTPAPKVPGAK